MMGVVSMIGSIIVLFICMWTVSLMGGIILGKLMWRPPGK